MRHVARFTPLTSGLDVDENRPTERRWQEQLRRTFRVEETLRPDTPLNVFFVSDVRMPGTLITWPAAFEPDAAGEFVEQIAAPSWGRP
jgi:hypothetical protein